MSGGTEEAVIESVLLVLEGSEPVLAEAPALLFHVPCQTAGASQPLPESLLEFCFLYSHHSLLLSQ